MEQNTSQSPLGPIMQPAAGDAAAEAQRKEEELKTIREEDRADALDELQFDAPALSGMTQNALTVETGSEKSRASNGVLEISGGYSDNIYSRASNKISSAFVRYTIPLTYAHTWSRTRFSASYLPEFTSYSQAEGLYQSHVYQHTLLYDLSARSTLSWQLTAARYHDVGQFLPVVLPIGGTGIAQPTGSLLNTTASSTLTNSNVATSVALLHRMTARDRITYTGTVSWSELLQSVTPAAPGTNLILRSQPTAGDVLYEHSISSSTSLGIEGTEAYVRGLSNGTSLTYSTLLGTIRYIITPNDTFSFGIGPLIPQTNGHSTSASSAGTTYAVNALYMHQSRNAVVSGGYSRVIQLNLDNTFTVAHQLTGNFTRPITSHINAGADIRYIHAPSSEPNLRQTNFGGSVRLDYRTGTRLSWFANASKTYSSLPPNGANPTNFGRGEISCGLRIALRSIVLER